jgi:hypothetical protein
MEPYFAMGIFAIYVMVASLVQHLSERDSGTLPSLKRTWGRREGIALHFVAFVGVPLIFGVVFLGRGIAEFDPADPAPLYAPAHHQHALPHLYGRTLSTITVVDPSDIFSTGEFPILLASSQEREPFSFTRDTEKFRPVPLSFYMP